MKQFAIIGLGNFGRRILEEVADLDCEILIIDKDREIIEIYKDRVANAFIADAINAEIINKLIPATIDAAIVDLHPARIPLVVAVDRGPDLDDVVQLVLVRETVARR